MRTPRVFTAASILLVASFGLVATPVWAKKNVVDAYMLGDMSAHTLAQTPTVTSLLDTLGMTAEIGPEDAVASSGVDDVSRVIAILSSMDAQSPEAIVLLDTFAAGDATCPLDQTETAEAGMEADDGWCGGTYEVCMESCSARATKRRWWLPGWRREPAPGACELVCSVAREGCLSCARKAWRHAMLTRLRNVVPCTARYLLSSLVAIFTACWMEILAAVYHELVDDSWVATAFAGCNIVYRIARSAILLESFFWFAEKYAVQALFFTLLWSMRKIADYRKKLIDQQLNHEERIEDQVEARVRAAVKELRMAEENTRVLRERREIKRNRGRLDDSSISSPSLEGDTLQRRDESGTSPSFVSLRMVVGFFTDRLPLIGRS